MIFATLHPRRPCTASVAALPPHAYRPPASNFRQAASCPKYPTFCEPHRPQKEPAGPGSSPSGLI
jgi:hypothetical protein